MEGAGRHAANTSLTAIVVGLLTTLVQSYQSGEQRRVDASASQQAYTELVAAVERSTTRRYEEFRDQIAAEKASCERQIATLRDVMEVD